MKHIDYLYFNIYSLFYRISLYRQNFRVRLQAMYLFSLGSGGWLLLLEAVYLRFMRRSWFQSPTESTIFAAVIYMLTATLFNYIFIIRDRDLKIFGKYEELANQNPKRKRHVAISISILLIPYLALLAFAIIFPRHR